MHLTRSRTVGEDRDLNSRTAVVAACWSVFSADWLSTGWHLLNSHAEFTRDFLFSMSSTNHQSLHEKNSGGTTLGSHSKVVINASSRSKKPDRSTSVLHILLDPTLGLDVYLSNVTASLGC